MMTLRMFETAPPSIPYITASYLSDLGVSLGKQELYTKQSPQKLKALREHALIESAVSSNRIEGVTVDQSRVATIVFGKPHLRDRDEEEVRGYRNALKWIHEKAKAISFSEETVKRLHALSRNETGDAGQYKETQNDIIEKYPGGGERVRFRPVSPAKIPAAMKEFVSKWNSGIKHADFHPVLLMAASNLDFLCIHPFRDGNGRVSRLLFLLQANHLGYEVGRYISLERVIEQNKDRYYETLEQSSKGWHDGKHDPWPYINYLLYILKTAYKEFEQRVGDTAEPKGAKTEIVIAAIERTGGPFRVAEIQHACPGVGLDLIRKVMKNLKREKKLECLGRGPSSAWQKAPEWRKR